MGTNNKLTKGLRVIGVVLSFAWVPKVIANRRAKKLGLPKLYGPGEILGDVLGSALDVADEVKPGWRE